VHAFLIAFLPVMVNLLSAVCTVDPDLVNLARAFKVTFVAFCFAKPKDAEAFAEWFGGEQFRVL
jgi:hypothetical protein